MGSTVKKSIGYNKEIKQKGCVLQKRNKVSHCKDFFCFLALQKTISRKNSVQYLVVSRKFEKFTTHTMVFIVEQFTNLF